MARAIEVARYLIRLAENEEEPDFLTHLRLQKLLYYVQAWWTVQRDGVIFTEPISAWVHGPVVREVYSAFSNNGQRPIMPEEIGDNPIDLTEEEREFIASVWESYKGYSALKPRDMTHQEDPWINARKGYAPADRGDEEITPEALRAYFSGVSSE
jgi:uncharacterized phage-associated protein